MNEANFYEWEYAPTENISTRMRRRLKDKEGVSLRVWLVDDKKIHDAHLWRLRLTGGKCVKLPAGDVNMAMRLCDVVQRMWNG